MSAFHFANLTPDLILDALANTGVYLDSGLTALNSYENRVYQFRGEDQLRYVVKFYRPERWSAEQIREEHALAAYLQEQEVNVACPLLLQGQTLHYYQGFLFAVWPSFGGRHLEPDNLDQLEAVGHQLGRWHSISAGLALPSREKLTYEGFVLPAIAKLKSSRPWPVSLDKDFHTLLTELQLLLAAAFKPSGRRLPLHGDCHIGNVLWRDELPLLVDLDDCLTGPAVQDLWMLLSGEREEQRIQLDAILAGYEEFCDFDLTQLQLIEPLRTTRMLRYLVWLQLRWDDPAFPMAFPWYGSEIFWQQQHLQLTQQLAALKLPFNLHP